MAADCLVILTSAAGIAQSNASSGPLDGGLTGELHSIAEYNVHTPLIVHAGGGHGGLRQSSLVQSVDLAPTLLEWFNVDGHDIAAILDALSKARECKGRPTQILLRTVKGKGVSFMENNPEFHGAAPNPEQARKALAEIGAQSTGGSR